MDFRPELLPESRMVALVSSPQICNDELFCNYCQHFISAHMIQKFSELVGRISVVAQCLFNYCHLAIDKCEKSTKYGSSCEVSAAYTAFLRGLSGFFPKFLSYLVESIDQGFCHQDLNTVFLKFTFSANTTYSKLIRLAAETRWQVLLRFL